MEMKSIYITMICVAWHKSIVVLECTQVRIYLTDSSVFLSIYKYVLCIYKSNILRFTEKRIRAKIRHAAKTAENVANVIGWFDPLLIGRSPVLDNALHDRNPGENQVLETGQESAPVRVEEELVRREPRRRTIEVRRRPHDDDAGEIDDAGLGAAEERFEDGAIFLCGGAVMSGAVGDEADVFFKGAREGGAGVEDVARRAVTGNQFRWLIGGCVRVPLAEGDRRGGVL